MPTMLVDDQSIQSHMPKNDALINATYVCIGIPAPTNVSTTVLTPHSIEVTWNKSLSSDVTGYLISFNTTAPTGGGSVTVNGRDNTSGILANLEENTSYSITVQAFTNGNISANGNEVLVATHVDGK